MAFIIDIPVAFELCEPMTPKARNPIFLCFKCALKHESSRQEIRMRALGGDGDPQYGVVWSPTTCHECGAFL